MTGEGAAPVPYVYQPTATGEIPASTTTQEGSTNITTKGLDPRSYEAYQEWLKAQDAQAAAQQSPTLGAAPTAADVDADIASQASSQQAIERQAASKTPDPFDPSAANQSPLTSMGGLPGVVPTQALSRPAAPAEDMPRSFTSQEFRATPEMRGPQTLAAAQDEAGGYQAQQKAKLAADEAQQRAAIEAERAKRLDEAMKRMDAATQQYQKDSSSLFEKPSTFTRIMRGVASGLGAYGAIVGHSQNFAQQAIEAGIQQDMEEKKAILASSLKRMEYAGVAPERIQQWAKQQQEALLAKQQAQLNVIETRAQTMLAPYPQKQAAAAQAIAETREKQRAEAAKFLGEHLGSTREAIGEKVTTVAGDKQATRSAPTPAMVDEYTRARLNAKHISAIDEADLPTGEQMNQIVRNEHAIIAQNEKEAKNGQLSVTSGDVLRWLNAIPANAYDVPGMTDRQKETARIITENTHALFAKRWTPGSIGIADAYEHGMAPISPQPKDTPDQISRKFRELKEYSQDLADELERISKPGIQSQKIGDVATPTPGRKYQAQQGAPDKAQMAREWSKIPKEAKADLQQALKDSRDPKASPAKRAAAQRYVDQMTASAPQ